MNTRHGQHQDTGAGSEGTEGDPVENLPGVSTERLKAVVREAVSDLAGMGPWKPHPELCDAIANRVAERLAADQDRERKIIPFTTERQSYVNGVALRGGEVPLPEKLTPEQLADHCNRMICSFWSWPGNEYSNGELVYRVTLGALRRMQELASSHAQRIRAQTGPDGVPVQSENDGGIPGWCGVRPGEEP